MSIDFTTFTVLLPTFCLKSLGEFIPCYGRSFGKTSLIGKFVLGFAIKESWCKLLHRLYISFEQRLNNLVRYGGDD
jgi:hypothetical protein